MIKIEAMWLAVEPLDMRAGTESALARVVKVLRSRGADVDISSAQWQRYFGPRHRRTA